MNKSNLKIYIIGQHFNQMKVRHLLSARIHQILKKFYLPVTVSSPKLSHKLAATLLTQKQEFV
jgi:hypothetical protein